MIEVPKTRSKSAVLEAVIVSGLFLSAFYFFYFEEINLKASKLYKDIMNPDVYSDKPRQQLDESLYEGRGEFCSQSNPNKCVRGFRLPNNIDGLKFINGKINIITLPDTKTFTGLPEMALVQVSRHGNKLIYEGRINGVQGVYSENYESVKNKIILPNNSFLLTN